MANTIPIRPADQSQSATSITRYPQTLGSAPYEKWMLFEVRTGRHIGRTGMTGEGAAVDRTLAACALYLPDSALTSKQSISWQADSYGAAAGKAIEGAFQTGSAGELKTGLGAGGAISGLLSGIGAGLESKGLDAINQQTEKLKSYNAGQGDLTSAAIGGLAGATVNPRTDIFFKNVEYREHRFDFKLIPRSLQEAKNIDTILNIFHFYSLPSYGEGAGDFFIGYPYEFVITLFTQIQGTHHLNTIGRSVLTSVEVNHAAGNQVAFVDEWHNQQYYPAVTSLELNFHEVRLLGRDNDASKKNVIFRGTNNTNPGFEDPRAASGHGTLDAVLALAGVGAVVVENAEAIAGGIKKAAEIAAL